MNHKWPAALELKNQRQQVGIHGSFVRLQTGGLTMKKNEKRLETLRDCDDL